MSTVELGLGTGSNGSAQHVLLIRADADAAIGTGHLMRCLALAEGWRERGGSVVLARKHSSEWLDHRYAEVGATVHSIEGEVGDADDQAETASLAEEVGASWVLLDGYRFGADFQRALQERGLACAFIDDYGHADAYCAEIVVNQNVYADASFYANRSETTRLLLGTRYVLLRKAFRVLAGMERSAESVPNRVLVTLGGADPGNVTVKVLTALQLLDVSDLEVHVLLGATNPHQEEVVAAARLLSCHVDVRTQVYDMPGQMAWADMAVCAGGTTCYELLFMGLPFVALVLADNQRRVAEGLAARGMGICAGASEISAEALAEQIAELRASPETRAGCYAAGRQSVDGRGVDRVLDIMYPMAVRFRRANEEDCAVLWEWANDPVARDASFSSVSIPWESHVRWFNERCADPACALFVAVDEHGQPSGSVRYEGLDAEAVISIYVSPPHRGFGYGSRLIEATAARVFASSDATVIHAYIKVANEASKQAFLKAGFAYLGETVVRGAPALHMRMSREPGSVSGNGAARAGTQSKDRALEERSQG